MADVKERATPMPQSEASYAGLSEIDVLRLKNSGDVNITEREFGDSIWTIFRRNALSVVNILLFAISIGLVILGLPRDAVLTAGIVLMNVGIGIFQEVRAKRKLQQIALLNHPSITVIRSGRRRQIAEDEIVLGDTLVVEAGDQVPVDAALLSSSPIRVDESNLTGESDLISKRRGDELLSGTICVVGSGICEVVRVGSDSAAQRITSQARSYRNIKTPLQRDIDIIIQVMSVVVALMSIRLLINFDGSFTDLPIVETARASAVLVALVPQGLILMVIVAYSLAALRLAPRGALIQRVNAVESLSHINILCVDKTGTLTTQKLQVHELRALDVDEAIARQWLGDVVANTLAANKTSEAIAAACPGSEREVRAEIPFASIRKWSALSFDGESGGTFVLGAPEILLSVMADASPDLTPQVADLARQGYRVLLFARAEDFLLLDDAPDDPELPSGLKPVALISIQDELRPGVQATIKSFSEVGVRLKVISGDNPETVLALAKQAGFPESSEAIAGADLDRMSDEELEQAAEDHIVFGRVTPETKERLVEALERRGNWVAMTGDGVNDILALKRARVGIAMRSGSDATRSVADMVLMNDSFDVLPPAFAEGQKVMRGMTDNIKLFLTRTLSIVFLIFLVTLIGEDFPLTPGQNSILALVTVGIPALALAVWAKPGRVPRRLGKLVVEFVLPAALMVSIISFAVYDFFLTMTRNNVEWSQAAVATTLVSTLLLIVLFAQPPSPAWTGASSLNGDRRPLYLVGAMYSTYFLILLIPWTRNFFDLQTLPWSGYIMLAFIVVGWAVAVRLIWRKALGARAWDYSEARLERLTRQLGADE